MLRLRRALITTFVATTLSGRIGEAQGSLLLQRRASATPRIDQVTFKGNGVPDGSVSNRVRTLSQVSVPASASFALGSSWRLDFGASVTNGEVEFADSAGRNTTTVSLSGLSDVRVRASGSVAGDALVVSVGLNLPSGATSLDSAQLRAVRVLAAPAFGIGLPALGFGPAGAIGVVGTRAVGSWVGALGASFEYRGKYSPVAALQSGAAPDYDPGNAMHMSLGLERFVGDSRLSLQVGTDLYSDDVLSSGANKAQTVKLGPVVTVESSLSFASTRIRDGRLSGSLLRRSSFERDGVTVPGGSGTYLSAGLEAGLVLTRSYDVHVGGDVLLHSGLDVDDSIMTAKTRHMGLLAGLRFRGSSGYVEPFVRVGTGSIDPGAGSVSFTGIAGGVQLTIRF